MLSQNYPTDYLNFKNCLFRSSSVVKISYKGKWIYSGYGSHLMEQVHGVSNNDVARNVIIFVVNNGAASHADN